MKQSLVFKQPIFAYSSIYSIVDILNVCVLKLPIENWKYEPYC